MAVSKFELITLLMGSGLDTVLDGYSEWEEAAEDLIAKGVTVQEHAKWEIRSLTAHCSNCDCANRHIPVRAGSHGTYIPDEDKPRFCENCGAKMDQED